jgi:hypothetical protein
MESHFFPLRKPEGVGGDSIWIFHRLEFGFVGLNSEDFVVAVFPVDGKIPLIGRCPGALRLEYSAAVSIEVEGGRFSSNCGFITLTDRALERSYWAMVKSIARSLAGCAHVSAREVGAAFAAWELLFQSRRRLSLDEEMGLWGELFFVLSCSDLDRAIACWRGPSAEDFDFLASDVALEVKTSKRFGRHVVSHAQAASVTESGRAYLVSVWVGENELRGVSLPSLVDSIASMTSDFVTFEERLLGAKYSHADRHLYDRKFASMDDFLLFDLVSVPKVRQIDPGVISLSYSVQLDASGALSLDDKAAVLLRAFGD